MARKLPKKIEKVLEETKSRLTSIYAQRLKGIILFDHTPEVTLPEGLTLIY